MFVIDFCRGTQGFFQAMGTIEGRGPPEAIDVPNLVRDVDPALLRNFLLDQGHGENRQQVFRGNRLHGAGIDHRSQRTGHVGNNVVPLFRDLIFGKQDFRCHGISLQRGINRLDMLARQNATACRQD